MSEDVSVNYVEDPSEIERRLNHKAAHRARMAHRVIRLREVGYDKDLDALLKDGESVPRPAGEILTIGGAEGLARLIHSVIDGSDKDRPGPTDSAYAKKLFTLDRSTLFQEWNENATEASHDFDADAALEALASQEEDLQAFKDTPENAEEVSGDLGVIRAQFIPHGLDGEWAANALYDLGREGFLAGEIDWDTAVIKVDLIDTGAYTIDLATHKFRSSVAAGARIASSAALASKTVAAGVADAADITYTALTGVSIELILIYQSSAVGGGADVADTAQRLIAAIDTATGLPFTPSGGDVTVTWDNTTNRIFKL